MNMKIFASNLKLHLLASDLLCFISVWKVNLVNECKFNKYYIADVMETPSE